MSASCRENTSKRSWYSIGTFVLGFTSGFGDRAFSISRIDMANTSTFRCLVSRVNGAAPIMHISSGLVGSFVGAGQIPAGVNFSGTLLSPVTCTGKFLGAQQDWRQWFEAKVSVLRPQLMVG